ncbi:hypothetical protein HYS31_08690 [Candidatus Woesearchaeota archaeon]|nr:hypothetical protein [Candidatus Woesearchaeota archaeon]
MGILKESLFIKSLKLAKSRPGNLGLMVLFDAAFFLSFFYLLPYLAGYFGEAFLVPFRLISSQLQYLTAYFLFSAIYYLLMIFTYSFFKYVVLDAVRGLFQKSEFSFKGLARFYALNLILVLPIYLAFSLLLANVQPQYRPAVFIIAGLPLFLLLYTLINLSHSYYYSSGSIKRALEVSFRTGLGFKKYKSAILAIIMVPIGIFALFYAIWALVGFATSSNSGIYLNAYSYYRQISILFTYAAFYFVILVNRISFYRIARG